MFIHVLPKTTLGATWYKVKPLGNTGPGHHHVTQMSHLPSRMTRLSGRAEPLIYISTHGLSTALWELHGDSRDIQPQQGPGWAFLLLLI